MYVEKSSKPASKLSSAEDTEDLEEDDDPSLKARPAQVPRKSNRKPASKAKPPKPSGKSKQRSKALSEEPDGVASETEPGPKPTRSRTKSGRAKSKGQDEEAKGSEREADKPPSNVDGKIAKAYRDFTVDINELEEVRGRDNKGKGRGRSKGAKGRSTSVKARSRSKSKARSTGGTTLIDPHEKPLLRASSRTRISGLTEMEEMETEKMLAETPSETDVEPEPVPPRATEPKPRVKNVPEDSDSEGVVQKSGRVSSRPASVASEKSASSKASKQGKPPGKKTAAKAKVEQVEVASSKQYSRANSEVEEESDLMLVDHPSRIGADDRGLDLGEATPRPAPPSGQPALPAPTSPSDFKTAPSRPIREGKPTSKLKSGLIEFEVSRDPKKTPAQPERSKPYSAKAGKSASEKPQSVSKNFVRQADGMDVDDDQSGHSRSRSREGRKEQHDVLNPVPQTPVDARVLSLPRTPEPSTRAPPDPSTPENQIIRNGVLEPTAGMVDFQTSLQVPSSPASLFIPPLANSPLVINELTEEERNMTVEQWIRHEIANQYQRLKEDGERRIRQFLEKAEETRRQIEAL